MGALLGGRAQHHARLHVVVLMRVRGGEAMLLPGDFVDLVPGDELLFAGQREARRALTAILAAVVTYEAVRFGSHRREWLERIRAN